jgi:hypothetical protein
MLVLVMNGLHSRAARSTSFHSIWRISPGR